MNSFTVSALLPSAPTVSHHPWAAQTLHHLDVFASRGGRAGAWKFHDYLFVGTPTGMAALASMSDRPLEYGGEAPLMRCHAWCEEEQTKLQLLRQGVSVAPLGGRVNLSRVLTHSAVAFTPALSSNASSITHHGGCIRHRGRPRGELKEAVD